MRTAAAKAATAAAEAERRLPHVAAIALAAGLAAAGCGRAHLLLPAIAVLTVLTAAGAPRSAILAATLLVAGGLLGAARIESIDAPGRQLHAGAAVEGVATLIGPPRPGAFGSSVPARLEGGPARGAKVMVRLPRDLKLPDAADAGDRLRLSGFFRHPARRPGADFDYGAYLRRQGIAGEVPASVARPTGSRRGGLAGAVDSMRRRSRRAIAHGLSPPAAALADGMVLGQDQQIAAEVRDDFQASGLAHILAVSGQNVMLLAALGLPLFTAIGLVPRVRLAATVALIALYVPLAGAGPSLQRAGVMGGAALVALGMGRPASRWYVLGLAACATLALNPRACGDPGWQLSFAAVIGILVLAPTIRRPLAALPAPLAEGIALTVAATIATAPLMAHHFGSVSLAGLPANALALPLVAPIMWLGMVRAAIGQLGTPATPLLDVIGVALAPALAALSRLATAFADIPGGQLALPLGSRLAVPVAYAILAAVCAAAHRAGTRVDVEPTKARWRRARHGPRIAIVCTACAAAALVLLRLTAPGRPPSRFTVSFLDIGQGDATLVQAPDGTAVLFDGGPPEGRVTRLLRRAGVRRLALVVSTHQSRDHHAGLQSVVESVPVDTLLENGDGTRDRTYDRVVNTARAHGARIISPHPGEVVRTGPLRITVYGPPPREPGPPPEDANLRAIPAVVSYGAFDLFLSGDAESDALEQYDLPPVEAMKVSHHGSDDPGLPELLRRLRPRVAGIEVGEGNTYGHPRGSTLAALRHARVKTYRTDRQGTVRLSVDGQGRMAVHTER
ncbi:MAG: ComEC/Rec2 family competence protein [Thermoleophilaceae bacterium]